MRVALAASAALPLLGAASSSSGKTKTTSSRTLWSRLPQEHHIGVAKKEAAHDGTNSDGRPLWMRPHWQQSTTSMAERVECDPSRDDDDDDAMEPDVGILSSPSPCQDNHCIRDSSSSLGGHCHPRQGTMASSSARRQYRWLQQQSTSSNTIEVNTLLSACSISDGSGMTTTDERCDCSLYPQQFTCQIATNECYAVQAGLEDDQATMPDDDAVAMYTNVCFDQTISVQQQDENGGMDVTYCTSIRLPSLVQYCVTGHLDEAGVLTDCSIQMNEQSCNACTVGTCNDLDEVVDITTFDCSNTDMTDSVGSACNGDVLFPLVNSNRQYVGKGNETTTTSGSHVAVHLSPWLVMGGALVGSVLWSGGLN